METYILTFVFYVFSHASSVSASNISTAILIDCQDFWCLYEEAYKQAGFKPGQDLTNTGRVAANTRAENTRSKHSDTIELTKKEGKRQT